MNAKFERSSCNIYFETVQRKLNLLSITNFNGMPVSVVPMTFLLVILKMFAQLTIFSNLIIIFCVCGVWRH